MKVLFGLALDDPAFPLPAPPSGNIHVVGPQRFLHLLEAHMGLSRPPQQIDYLRIEQYRQALTLYLTNHPEAFFKHSFQADQFATASELLSRRDELLLAGWDFQPLPNLPGRLQCFARVESLIRSARPALTPGFADRFITLLQKIDQRKFPPFSEILLNDSPDLLPLHWQNLFRQLQKRNIPVIPLSPPDPPATPVTDLQYFQSVLHQGKQDTGKRPFQADGSLLILRSKRETDLATYLAKFLKKNRHFTPLCLIPQKNRILDNALLQEALPGMGMLSASLARPTLQVLKLVTVFLWRPVDPFKIMEFVSLSVKPLEEGLANRIAVLMAQTPGLFSDAWYAIVHQYFDELEHRAASDSSIDPVAIRNQYRFWFERKRYDSYRTVPKDDVVEIFDYLQRWSLQCYEENGSQNQSLLILREQARQIRDLLEALPEVELTQLELERIVRTIYEPSPIQFREGEKGRLPFVHQPHAITGAVRATLWWNFIQNEQDHFFSRWYQVEKDFLLSNGVVLQGPKEENARLIRRRKQPVLYTQEQLLLVVPDYIDGQPALPHPLLGDLEAAFSGVDAITLNIDMMQGASVFERFFTLPEKIILPLRKLGRPKSFLHLPSSRQLQQREEETFSSLNALFYYPYQWVLKYKTKLAPSSILSIVKDVTLMGNLAHRFFERLFKNDVSRWTKSQVEAWIDAEAGGLLNREGAVLLMYGREPERINFIKRVKYAAWSLVHLIQANRWTVVQTEKTLEGKFLNVPIAGRADLVLQREDELAVIDLKWRGASRRERIIRNEEDLQLVMYAKLLTDDETWAHTAYFIIENGKMIARNQLAFEDISAVSPESDHVEVNQRIYQRMAATYQWRMDQIRQGLIEIRCQYTQTELEERYAAILTDLLEMKKDDAPFDDYRTLINLVE